MSAGNIDVINCKTAQKIINNIDWKLLQRQKKTIEKLIIHSAIMKTADIARKELDNLWGVIELIENLQDIHELNNIVHFERINGERTKI